MANKKIADLPAGSALTGVEIFEGTEDPSGTPVSKKYTTDQFKSFIGGVEGILINGSMALWQRGTTFDATTTPANSDDTYLMDRWVLLSDGNDVVDVTRSTDIPTGVQYSCKFDVETANKKFGILQIVETSNAAKIVGGTASLSFSVKGDGNLANVRAAVLSWNSTADAVTSDVVSAWNAAGANPTLVANWTAENTASNIALTTSWVTHTIEDISIDTASTTNVALFLWLDDTDAQVTENFFVSKIKLEEGTVATPFVARLLPAELLLAQRYHAKDVIYAIQSDASVGGEARSAAVVFPTTMRVTPTTTVTVTTHTNTTTSGVPGTVTITVNGIGAQLFSSVGGSMFGYGTYTVTSEL